MFFIYVCLVIALYLVFKLLQARHVFNQIKQRNEYNLLKVEHELSKSPENPVLYCIRGSLYLTNQDFISANRDFKIALTLITDEVKCADNNLEMDIQKNIQFTNKPFPWSKGEVKNLSNSWVTFYLLKIFGNSRMIIVDSSKNPTV